MSAVLLPAIEGLPMRLEDVDEVLAIEEDLYPFPWTRGNFVDSIASGYSAWGYRVDEAHLLNISVAAQRQRMGFGARLLSHARQGARQAGATSLLLEVRPSNEKALALYRRFGFRQIGVRRAYYPAAQGREDALVLKHVLAEDSA